MAGKKNSTPAIDVRPDLVCLPYSPWSLKARWALNHCKCDYKYTEFTPVFGERGLRKRLVSCGVEINEAGVTVPVLFSNGKAFADSHKIALWAEKKRSGAGDGDDKVPTLFPDGLSTEVFRWNENSERVLDYGRAEMLTKAATDKSVCAVFVPSGMRFLGPIGLWIATLGVKKTLKKYNANAERNTLESTRQILTELRDVLALSGGQYIFGQLSYADFCMAISLQFISPVEGQYTKVAAKMRKVSTISELAEEFKDILEWRNKLFATWHYNRPKADASAAEE